MTDLVKMNLRKNEEQLLINQGFTTIEAIAMASRYDLGFSKKKSDQLITAAQNIILNDCIINVVILNDSFQIFVNRVDTVVQHCLADQFGLWSSNRDQIIYDELDDYYCIPLNKDTEYYGRKWEQRFHQKQIEEKKRLGISMDEVTITTFAKELGFEGFWQTAFQEIEGNEIMKKALTIAIFSTFDEPCHICILGDPGSAKSLSYEVISRYFPDIVPIGANSTKAGLVINLATGELGALASSDQKIVMADEFDKIPKTDVNYIYELLSSGKCRVDSARIHDVIESHFIFIAMGNPTKEVFGKTPLEQINLPPTLMSRFALIVRTEVLQPEERQELFKKKFFQNFQRLENPEMFVQWVRLARAFQPKILVNEYEVEEYIESLGRVVNGYYHSPLRRDLRMGDYMRRIPLSIARASFEDITEDTLEQATEIIIESIESWGKLPFATKKH